MDIPNLLAKLVITILVPSVIGKVGGAAVRRRAYGLLLCDKALLSPVLKAAHAAWLICLLLYPPLPVSGLPVPPPPPPPPSRLCASCRR